MGRAPTGQARTEKVYGRVTPAAKAEFAKECEKRGVTESDAVREGLKLWIQNGARR